MKKTMEERPLSRTAIEDALWEIRRRVDAKVGSAAQTDRAMSPLSWYVSTGRMPTPFLKFLVNCTGRQYTTIANRLIKGGTDNDVMRSVCGYINTCMERMAG